MLLLYNSSYFYNNGLNTVILLIVFFYFVEYEILKKVFRIISKTDFYSHENYLFWYLCKYLLNYKTDEF